MIFVEIFCFLALLPLMCVLGYVFLRYVLPVIIVIGIVVAWPQETGLVILAAIPVLIALAWTFEWRKRWKARKAH